RAAVLVAGDRLDGDPGTVVGHGDTPVTHELDQDLRGAAGQGLIDRVVDDLVDQVVQTARAGGTDVHAGAFADRFDPLENLAVFERKKRPQSGLSSLLGRPLAGEPEGAAPPAEILTSRTAPVPPKKASALAANEDERRVSSAAHAPPSARTRSVPRTSRMGSL